jgi:hypothetical protein
MAFTPVEALGEAVGAKATSGRRGAAALAPTEKAGREVDEIMEEI